jgi:glycerol-3-phosphate dehydrogenase
LLRRNAPHLVRTLGFVIPSYDWWAIPFYGFGMKVYDFLSGKLNLATSHPLSKSAALESVATLKAQGLRGGVLYYDAQFDDARLAIALMRTLLDLGGVALNYAPVVGVLKAGGRISGVRFRDSEGGEEIELKGKAIINATGVFVDVVRQMDEPSAKPMLSPSQGVHLIIDRKFLPGDHALMIPKTDDGRVLFAVPWHEKVILGTTDNAVPEVSLEPKATAQEVAFILRTAGRYLNPAPTQADVLSVFAGLRPLVKAEGSSSTSALSRDHSIRVSESGLITITGGKWTTYRKMGEDVVNRAVQIAGLTPSASKTPQLKLHGHSEEKLPEPLGVYGSDAKEIGLLPGAFERFHPALPYSEAQVRYAARQELARTVEDVLARRTRALLLGARASIEAAPKVAAILADELGLSPQWQQAQVEHYRQLAQGYLPQG